MFGRAGTARDVDGLAVRGRSPRRRFIQSISDLVRKEAVNYDGVKNEQQTKIRAGTRKRGGSS
jgi:hypothetical protein